MQIVGLYLKKRETNTKALSLVITKFWNKKLALLRFFAFYSYYKPHHFQKRHLAILKEERFGETSFCQALQLGYSCVRVSQTLALERVVL